MFEEGLARLVLGVENAARDCALEAFRRTGPAGTVSILASAGHTGMVGMAAARLLINWLPPNSVRLGFLGIDDYATGEVHHALTSTRELPLDLCFLTREDNISQFVAQSDNTCLIVAASAGEGGFRAEVAESEAATSSNPDKIFVSYQGGVTVDAPDLQAPLPRPDVPPLTREAVRNLDRIAMDKYGIRGVSLMENAGWNLARETLAEIRSGNLCEPLLILAGRGNNGGDGLVAARHLAAWGIDCRVVMIGTDKPSTDDALINYSVARDAGVPVVPTSRSDISAFVALLEQAGSVMDAVLGTGLDGRLRGATADALAILAATSLPVIAADTPSGLDANTGNPLGVVPKALVTVTFAATKPGFEHGLEFAGEIRVADIGAPWSIARQLAATN
ncbi:MAG: NAD(P)H-hydrate epimerase [Planctomycetes bacterium]|nr:NAD(P)H-hydrate epimerase [Planctomycetota bacterium]